MIFSYDLLVDVQGVHLVPSCNFISMLGRKWLNLALNQFVVSTSRFTDFGVDGGPAAKYLGPKFNVLSNHVSSQTGLQVPEVQVRITFISAFCFFIEIANG